MSVAVKYDEEPGALHVNPLDGVGYGMAVGGGWVAVGDGGDSKIVGNGVMVNMSTVV